MNSFKFKYSPAAFAAVIFVSISTFSSSAFALFSDDEARKAILDLRVQVTAGQNAQIEFQNQIEELSQENAKLRGRIDLLEKRFEELTTQQKFFYQDLNNRLKIFEPQSLEVEGIQGLVEHGEKDAYDSALKFFQDGQLKKADIGFQNFSNKYPNSPYWPLAQFWLGNSEYAQKDYKNAIADLQSLIKRYPLHARVPDALLTIANCQIESNQKPAGKKTLEILISKYPDTEEAGLAKQALKRIK